MKSVGAADVWVLELELLLVVLVILVMLVMVVVEPASSERTRGRARAEAGKDRCSVCRGASMVGAVVSMRSSRAAGSSRKQAGQRVGRADGLIVLPFYVLPPCPVLLLLLGLLLLLLLQLLLLLLLLLLLRALAVVIPVELLPGAFRSPCMFTSPVRLVLVWMWCCRRRGRGWGRGLLGLRCRRPRHRVEQCRQLDGP